MTNTLKFKFSLLPGDLIYALAGVKSVCSKYGMKADIYLGLNIEWQMAQPIKEGRKNPYTLDADKFQEMESLLLAQPYINSVLSWEKERPEEYAAWGEFFKNSPTAAEIFLWYKTNMTDIVDLDKNHVIPVNVPLGNIARWNFYTYPDMACDLSNKWISTFQPIYENDTIIINRTARYRNNAISYSFLKPYEQRITFIGSESEYNDFRFSFGLNVRHGKCENHYDIAYMIEQCQLFIGNQSLCFAIAEATKTPRILEISPEMPNVIPCGEKAYDFYHQSCFEHYVKELA